MDCCWNMIRSNLVEAWGELNDLRRRLRYCETGELPDPPEYGAWLERQWRKTTEHSLLFGKMEHAYHHLNFGWNCRRFPEKRVIACARRDYVEWQIFPRDWPELWPSAGRYTGMPGKVGDGKVCYPTMRIPLDEVSMTLDDVINDMDATFPECAEARTGPGKIRRGRPPMDEEGLGVQMRHIYIYMNYAWNSRHSRKLTLPGKDAESAATMKRNWQFPREFKDFWPKKQDYEPGHK